MGNLAYYVTGHGLGHARRAAEVIRATLHRHPEIHVYVRTSAPAIMFQNLGSNVHHEPLDIDRGAIEQDPLTLDWEATLAHVADVVARKSQIVAQEAAFIKEHEIRLVVADASFMAGYIAQAAGVPCWAVGNFVWDWIYEPQAEKRPRYQSLLEEIRGGYRQMEGLLQLPFAYEHYLFKQVVPVPLITTPPAHDRAHVLRMLAVDSYDTRPRILLAMRGGLDPETLRKAVRQAPDYIFLQIGMPRSQARTNLQAVNLGPYLTFWDVLSVCDAVVSKLGHGIVTDCIAGKLKLLWPPRNDFREDTLLAGPATQYGRLRQISLDDFRNGDWFVSLHTLLSMAQPSGQLPTDGATVCAEFLSRQL